MTPSSQARSFDKLLSLSWLVVVMLAGVSAARGQGFDSQCYGVPRNWNDIQNEPAWYVCLQNQLGCTIPSTPALDDTGSNDPIQSQTAWLKATTPSDFDIDIVFWEAHALIDGDWRILWEQSSREDVIPGQTTPYEVRYGAAGLPENSQVRFRVGYCSESSTGVLEKCTCRSEFLTQTTESLAGTPISGHVQRVEDSFRRKSTEFRNENGDALGAEAVWQEVHPVSTMPGRGRIIDAERAQLEEGNAGIYIAQTAASTRTYAQALYRRDPSNATTKYNVDVLARTLLNGIAKSYGLKLKNDGPGQSTASVTRTACPTTLPQVSRCQSQSANSKDASESLTRRSAPSARQPRCGSSSRFATLQPTQPSTRAWPGAAAAKPARSRTARMCALQPLSTPAIRMACSV